MDYGVFIEWDGYGGCVGRQTWGGKDKNTLVDNMIQVGYWPEREVNYADVGPTSRL
jgi:hypothetical protein